MTTSTPRTSETDILEIIKTHHKPLKQLIKVMKDLEKSLPERRKAFEEFGPLLTRHAHAEEQILYTFMTQNEALREEGLEGDVEHGLADQLCEEAKRTTDEDLFSAKVKVLAELVEHHIEEEEEEMFVEVRKETDPDERIDLGIAYLQAYAAITGLGKERMPGSRSKPDTHPSH